MVSAWILRLKFNRKGGKFNRKDAEDAKGF